MSSPVKKIEELLKFIPAKDIPYATMFFQKRDFESLRDIVKSDIIILRKRKSDDDTINILRELKAELDSYILMIGLEDETDENEFWV